MVDNKFGDEGARIIAEHLAKTRVETLHMSNVGITASGLITMAPAVAASKLKFLDIDENVVGDDGIKSLCAALRPNKIFTTLEAVSLCRTLLH